MSVSMATEQNGAGSQGAAGLCAAGAGDGREGLRVLGLLPRQHDGRCPSPSARAGPWTSTLHLCPGAMLCL